MGEAQRRWAEALAAWAIPKEILERAPESPWGFPRALFAPHRHELLEPTPSHRRALELLPAGGSVLDVGAGGGASSLPVAERAGHITAVDQSPEMLEQFVALADELGVAHREIEGSWPDVASRAGSHDVVVCHHVFYNVAELAPFVAALDDAAHRGVVVELTAVHPAVTLNELWRHFHGIDRPTGPRYEDALAVLDEIRIKATVERWERPSHRSRAPRSELVAFTRRRLCLPAERDAEIDALLDRESTWSPSEVVTLWWASGSSPRGDESASRNEAVTSSR